MSQEVLAPSPRLGTAPPADAARRSGLRAARVDAVMRWVVLTAAALSILVVVLVVVFLASKALPVLQTPGLGGFFGSATWAPDGSGGGFGGNAYFGALTPIAGSLMVVALALVIAVPLALARFRQFQAARREADSLRQALEDRKVIERAKGIVMKRLGVDEGEAFRRLRKLASDHNRKLVEVARVILAADDTFQALEQS